MAVQTKRVIIPEDMGSTVEFGGKETDKWNVNHDDTLTVKNGKLSVVPQQSGGLDCAAVGNLPKKPWAKGTTILARGADGACHQLTALDSIFQEVGVGIAANKLSGLTGEKYRVVVTVSNTGEGTNERTDLVIVRPQLGNYTANNFTKTASTGATIERTDDWNYVIKNLRKGGTARVEFDVTPNAAGTFQFSSSVNPNSALDQQSNNNRATITLSATTAANPDYVPSVDCPLIVATVDGEELFQAGTTSNGTMFTSNRLNLFMDKTSGDLVIKTKNASTVFVTKQSRQECSYRVANDRNIVNVSRWFTNSDDRALTRFDKNIQHIANVSDYTFENNTLTLRNIQQYNEYGVTISMRPQGNHCNWQAYHLVFGKPIVNTPATPIIVTGLPRDNYKITTSKVVDRSARVIPYDPAMTNGCKIFGEVRYSIRDLCSANTEIGATEHLVVTLQAGKEYNFSIENGGYTTTKGKTTITQDGARVNVRVSADATATDSVTFGRIAINIQG